MKKIRMNCTATLDETFADFLLSRRAKGLAEKTLESYSSQWKAVARHLDTGTDIAALQKADLDAMMVSMRDAGLSPNSINSYTRVLKSFFSWCNEQGLTRLNIPLYKAEETVKETYSDAELTALLKKPDIRKTTFAEYRDWVIINFLLNCGCRAATVRAIQIRDVDLDGGGDAFTLQKLLGHSTLAMTKHYCAIYDADLTKNYDNFSPLAQMKASGAKIKMSAKGR